MRSLPVFFALIFLPHACVRNESKTSFQQEIPADAFDFYEDDYIRIDTISRDVYNAIPVLDQRMFLDTLNRFVSQNDTLKIKLQNGFSTVFTDTLTGWESDGVRKNLHLGSLAGYHLVKTIYWEWADYWLVHPKTGEKYQLCDEPQTSPDQRIIVSSLGSLEYTGQSIFQLWDVKKDSLTKRIEIDLEPKMFELSGFRFKSKDELGVRITFVTNKILYGMVKVKK